MEVGLRPDSYPKELSRGMQQRVGLARGLAVDVPDILLMDEAFSALIHLIRTMQDELSETQEKDQRTILCLFP
ncbi:MAG: ATP-binding cassette domain-containing protein [Desulfobacterales bacterium]